MSSKQPQRDAKRQDPAVLPVSGCSHLSSLSQVVFTHLSSLSQVVLTHFSSSVSGRIQLWGHAIAVDWAEPEVEVDEDTMATVKILYVRNLMLQTTEETIEKEFNSLKPGTKTLHNTAVHSQNARLCSNAPTETITYN